MSQIRNVETQGVSSPIKGLTMVAVLCEAPDGWRVYEAACILRLGPDWDGDKAEAVAYAHRHGRKLDRSRARRYFNITDDMRLAP